MIFNKTRLLAYIGFISILMSIFIACDQQNGARYVSLEKKEPVKSAINSNKGTPLRIAIGSMITPKEGFAYYKHLAEYLGEAIGRPVQLVDRDTYAEVNNLLESNNLDIAFVCGGPYVVGHDTFGLEILVAPQVNGKTEYYSYIIVPAESQVTSFGELRGKSFAFTDPDSNSGKLVPVYLLSRMNESPDSFFKEHIYSYAHDKSIKLVSQNLIDGAAVDSLIWEYFNKTHPEVTANTKIIMKSPPYGIPPVVVPSGINTEMKNSLRQVFLDLHKNDKGKEILKGMNIDRFVKVDDSLYDSIREIKDFTSQKERN